VGEGERGVKRGGERKGRGRGEKEKRRKEEGGGEKVEFHGIFIIGGRIVT